MKKLAKIAAFLLLVIFLANIVSCSANRACRGMEYYNSDRKRGLAH
ncbi:MAG: hypothetical protein HXX09_10335 [Bacteroidetes bacterium]|nr:hypothetical protein [Bacteroidota bacterium]